MSRFARPWALAFVWAIGGMGAAQAQQCENINWVNYIDYQGFDLLAKTGTDNALPAYGSSNWYLSENGDGVRNDGKFAADDGTGSAGDTYSYGQAGSSDRALGTLRDGSLNSTFGACFVNRTSGIITSLEIVYTGEQWRSGASGRIDRLDFQYSLDATGLGDGTWIDFDPLDFASLNTTAIGALDGNAAPNREAQTGNIGGLSIPDGARFFVRWRDVDASDSDDGLAVDEFMLLPRGTGNSSYNFPVLLSISDAIVKEGDHNNGDPNTYLSFKVSLNREAPEGGVYFNYSTIDGTATGGSSDGDYVGVADGVGYIPTFSDTTWINIVVRDDELQEGDETLSVRLSNVTHAIVGDGEALGTILDNDNVTITPIHDIQGAGATSPLAGQMVATEGVVTGRAGDGLFVQAPDAEADANPATSEGVFVFTATVPPTAAVVGSRVRVRGAVVEFVPANDPSQPPRTQIGGSPSVAVLSTGHVMPEPVMLDFAFPDRNGAYDQLERLEGMRVRGFFQVVAPTRGTVSETTATAISNGLLYVSAQGVRPFREPGIQRPDSDPSGSTATAIPHWDSNPELLAVDSDAIGGPLLDIATGYRLDGLTGPLDYASRRYTILRDPNVQLSTQYDFYPGALTREPLTPEFTVASYNLGRFFDDIDDSSINEPVLASVAFANRLKKAAVGIRWSLHSPDILNVIEVENLPTLQALANKLNDDAVASGEPNPQYVAYLQEGNDVSGIDIGFLVKTAEIGAALPRIDVESVTQLGKDATWIDPSDNLTHFLNDRPPLLLRAIVHYADGGKFPISVLAVHSLSMNGINSEATNGLTTDGNRVRRKREAQAEFLANSIQQRQAADATEHLVVVGDFNAFEFNDGYVDVLGVVTGRPALDNQTAVPGDGMDLVTPNLINVPPSEDYVRPYSSLADGNAQLLSHVLVNEAMATAVERQELGNAHLNADYPEVRRNDDTAMRLSDRDPVMAYFYVPPQKFADLEVVARNIVQADGVLYFPTELRNHGPDMADFPAIGFAFNAEVPDLAINPPSEWTCDAPQIANGMTSVACTTDWLFYDYPPVFFPSILASKAPRSEPLKMAVMATSESREPNAANNATTTVAGENTNTKMALSWQAPAEIGRNKTEVTAVATLSNIGMDVITLQPRVLLSADVAASGVTLTPPYDWKCAVIDPNRFKASCEPVSGVMSSGWFNFQLQIASPGRSAKPIALKAQVSSFSYDANPADNVAEATIQVVGTR
jgi:uncharacterized protein